MAKDSKIEWTHHTFNPWWGCSKVSPACEHCYAEAWAKRVGNNIWGRSAPRRFFGDLHWKDPIAWNLEAKKSRQRRRVFCASMADVFERRSDLNSWRTRLWNLIDQTPMLDWLLLTKRPQNISEMVPWRNNAWPQNIWLGTTVENQFWANKRLPDLLKQKANVHFLSCEPLLGEIDLIRWIKNKKSNSIDWVIAGGESGPHSRPMNPDWARSLRDQCKAHSIAFHFKQWGHWVPSELLTDQQRKVITIGDIEMVAAGKRMAGRFLDGRTWDELPKIA